MHVLLYHDATTSNSIVVYLLIFIYVDTIFCVDVDSYSPDLVLIDFSVNDYGHPKLMDSLIRKSLSLKSNPEVILVNLWATASCPVTRYLHHALYYNIPVINLCPAITLCYGKNHLPKWRSDLYSLTDGVHPWGEKGVPFIGGILYHWWLRMDTLLTTDASETIQYTERNTDLTSSSSDFQQYLSFPKQPLYFDKSIGLCTRCDALVNDAPSFLTPIEEPVGFKVITRVKVGFGGFGTGNLTLYIYIYISLSISNSVYVTEKC